MFAFFLFLIILSRTNEYLSRRKFDETSPVKSCLHLLAELSYFLISWFIDLIMPGHLVLEYVNKIAGIFPFLKGLESADMENTGSGENDIGIIALTE